MSSTDSIIQKEACTIESDNRVHFPEIIDDKINTEEFLQAARDVVLIVDKFGKLFISIRYDMQGNIDKLTTRYSMDKKSNSTLQDMILLEKSTEENLIAVNALMCLTRIVEDHKAGKATEDLVEFLKEAYKETLGPYHGWIAQQLFNLLSRMAPTRSQLLLSLADEEPDKEEITLYNMELSLINLKKNVLAIKTFYNDHNL
ncbi:unnamed protein product [Lasius platythorax]|uniref:Glycolipid transfer protein domain-containing protein n=1 Tax=Lasius platythorax TaxID=488582 RepID=A0AAV2P353_9HYME